MKSGSDGGLEFVCHDTVQEMMVGTSGSGSVVDGSGSGSGIESVVEPGPEPDPGSLPGSVPGSGSRVGSSLGSELSGSVWRRLY